MKKVLFVICLTIFAMQGYAQTAHYSVGGSLGYATDRKNPTIGVDFRYNLFPDIRFAPSVTRLIRNNGVDGWYMDLDGHYVVDVTRDFSFYPIGGVSLSIWNLDEDIYHFLLKERVHTSHTRLGMNIGLGGEFRVTYEISIGMDFKYNVANDHSQALAAIRVGYHF
ncbi:MAG: porin family protein [Tannerella sp.]|jgi:opacity protein-like surface antigen|nr:porin family protein [Tannerella sp.]